MPLRIIQVCPEPFSHRGGVSRIVQRLLEGFPAGEVDVVLACPDDTGLSSAARGNVIETWTIPAGKWNASAAGDFVQRVRGCAPDLVHFHSGSTFGFDVHVPWRSPLHRMPPGIPWIMSNHCAGPFGGFLSPDDGAWRRMAKGAVAWVSKACALGRARAEVLDSKENQRQLARWFPLWSSRLRTIYHSGLSSELPRRKPAADARCIGNLGHIARRKGQFDLLDAFVGIRARHPDVRLVMMGDDGNPEDGRELRDRVNRHGLSACVSIPGGADATDSFWSEVDLYVQPSHFEGLPMALVEAMWRGLPCVATRVSGIPEVMTHEQNGLLCEPGQPDQLAAAIERLLSDGALRDKLGRAAQDTVREMKITRDEMVGRYLGLYREILTC